MQNISRSDCVAKNKCGIHKKYACFLTCTKINKYLCSRFPTAYDKHIKTQHNSYEHQKLISQAATPCD